MLNQILKLAYMLLLVHLVHSAALEEPSIDAKINNATITTTNVTTTTNSLFSYAGTELPKEWLLLSVINDRAVIAFKNGTSRNSLLTELSPVDLAEVKRVQSKAYLNTPLAKTKEKLSQWASSASTAVTKFSKGVAESMGNIFKSQDD